MGVADLCDACNDWSTVCLKFGQMSPTNVADAFYVSPTLVADTKCVGDICRRLISLITPMSQVAGRSSQWSSGSMSDCSARGPGIESRCGQLCYRTTTAIYSLGHELCAPFLQCLGQLSLLPYTWDGKWVSAFGLSNNNKWRWWL